MLTLISPAKVNLFLRVVKRRPDGYHELASLFQTINLCDTLHFSFSDIDRLTLTCTDPTIPTDGRNLVARAIDLFREKTQLDFGMSVHLEKRIPAQAGLGGGSSNAATTLWALNEMCGRPVQVGELAQWGSEIGSDVPFFLSQGTAYCTGRGEILRPLEPLKKMSFQIVKPPFGLSTPQVYGELDLKGLVQRDPEVVLEGFSQDKFTCFNDLEAPAFAIKPELADLKANLKEFGFEEVLMCGSGSAFFCLGKERVPGFADMQHFSAVNINRPSDSWYDAFLN